MHVPKNARQYRTVTDAGGGYEDLLALFADWRAVTTVDWNMDRWSANLAFRWMDDMILEYGSKLDSAMFTDFQVRYNPEFMDDALTVAIGFNNLFDEDPPVCDPCGSSSNRQILDSCRGA